MNTIQPKITLSPSPADKIVELIGLAGIVALIALPIFYFGQLPDSIPTHFGADGEPNLFGSRISIWVIPILGIVIYGSLFFLNKYPHIFNYAQPVTAENAERLYSTTTRLVRFINCLMAWLFVYITYGTIQVALGNQESLSAVAIIIFCLFTSIGVIFYLYQSRQKA